jgi:VanZ family protein
MPPGIDDGRWNAWYRWLVRNDKITHALAFAGYGAWFCSVLPRSQWWKIALLLLLYGLFIEALQQMLGFGRSGSWPDVAADAAGIVVGILLARWFGRDLIRAIDRWMAQRVPRFE